MNDTFVAILQNGLSVSMLYSQRECCRFTGWQTFLVTLPVNNFGGKQSSPQVIVVCSLYSEVGSCVHC